MLALRWNDIDWDLARFYVRSSKTEHHQGKEGRWVPLFPDLLEHLEAAWDAAEPGTKFVVTRYRCPSQNLRTTFQKIIHRAGLEPWPKLFQNLRATRATELTAKYPEHVASAWLGHSKEIAKEHYWQVTDADFERAAQKPAQHVHVEGRSGSQGDCPETKKAPDLRGVAVPCVELQGGPVAEVAPVVGGRGN